MMKYVKGSTIGQVTSNTNLCKCCCCGCCQHTNSIIIILPLFVDEDLSKLPNALDSDAVRKGRDAAGLSPTCCCCSSFNSNVTTTSSTTGLFLSQQQDMMTCNPKGDEILLHSIIEHVRRRRGDLTSTVIAPTVRVALHLLTCLTKVDRDPTQLNNAQTQQLLLHLLQDNSDNENMGQDGVGLWAQDRLVRMVWQDPQVQVRLKKLCDNGNMDNSEQSGWNQWLRLLMTMAPWTRCVVEQPPHPLVEYASNTVPHLTLSQLWSVREYLLPKLPKTSRRNDNQRLSPLVVQKWIQDYVHEQPERMYVILMVPCTSNDCSSSSSSKNRTTSFSSDSSCPSRAMDVCGIPHSCIPTAQMEVTRGGRSLAITALYDMDTDTDDITVNYWSPTATTSTVEDRDAVHQGQMGQSCHCLRCRYELVIGSELDHNNNNNNHVDRKDATAIATNDKCFNGSWLSTDDATRLARYYMSVGEVARAQILYSDALQQLTPTTTTTSRRSPHFAASSMSINNHNIQNEMAVVDLCHVLGAIEFTQGKFWNAQRIWKKACLDYPESARKHAGLTLQMEKMEAYEYFAAPKTATTPTPAIEFECPVPGVFVASVLDRKTCRQIVEWAESLGQWTRQRHYAVPTHDVPVHTVPPLLAWFQHQFMMPVLQPLLARQFGIHGRGRFYVHDAFVVRYTAGSCSNHLPIHTDESTHSFVLALNNDFTGGGTYFYDHDTTVIPAMGQVLSFAGGEVHHGGEAVTSGQRYILAGFLCCDSDVKQQTESLSSSDNSSVIIEASLNHEASQRKRGENASITSIKVSEGFRECKQQKTNAFSFGFAVDQ